MLDSIQTSARAIADVGSEPNWGKVNTNARLHYHEPGGSTIVDASHH